MLAASVAAAAQAARAQIAPGDLLLGFTSPTASTDYVVDLGQGFSSTSVTHLGSHIDLAQFTTGGAFPGGINGVSVGALFGSGGSGAAGDYAAVSLLRLGGAGSPGFAGTESAPKTPSGGAFVSAAANAGNGITLGFPAPGASSSFTFNSTELNPGTFANNLQLDPRSVVSGSTIELDLFESTRLAPVGRSTPASAFDFAGSLTIDFSGASPVVDFTPATAVPEPSTFSLIAGAGLLLISLRRQLSRATA
jgi:hypothetical protein